MAFGDRYTIEDLRRAARHERDGVYLSHRQVVELLGSFEGFDDDDIAAAYEQGKNDAEDAAKADAEGAA